MRIDVAIVGAGPFGLGLAAHLREAGVEFRIFGRLMESWSERMPKDMQLKSNGAASQIGDPSGRLTLKSFCAERGIAYSDDATIPVKVGTYVDFGREFQKRLVPDLEHRQVVGLAQDTDGFSLRLDSGESFSAKRVVLAVGITHFQSIPELLAGLPSEMLSHSAAHRDCTRFSGRAVAVVGAGSSAIDLAISLRDAGADVRLVARAPALEFHDTPDGKPRGLWRRLRYPDSPIGFGLRSRLFADAPGLFRYLPRGVRLKQVRTTYGPSGGWFTKEKIMGRVPLLLGRSIEDASARGGQAVLLLKSRDGARESLSVDHVVAATGYRPDVERLTFLDPGLRAAIETVDGSPALSGTFESSVPGLYFTGLSSANTFGPVMRFSCGSPFAARTVARALRKKR